MLAVSGMDGWMAVPMLAVSGMDGWMDGWIKIVSWYQFLCVQTGSGVIPTNDLWTGVHDLPATHTMKDPLLDLRMVAMSCA